MGSGKGLDGCFACIKYLMFAFNFLFWLIGCALVGFGIWVLVDKSFKELSKDTEFAVIQYAAIGLIAVGCIVMVVGFFGCCGAIRESQCLLVMFFVCMLILFMGLVAAGVMCIVYREEFTNEVGTEFLKQVKSYNGTSTSENNLVNLVQEVLSCCGYENYVEEYKNAGRYPKSCPSLKDGAKVLGCKKSMEQWLKDSGIVLGGVCIGTGAAMLIGLIFSMLLCCAIKESFDE